MKRNLLLISTLVLLAGLTYWAVSRQSRTTTLSDYEGSFAVPDTQMIGYIHMLDRNGRTLDLDLRNGRWMVNDRYLVEPRIMEEMLQTVSLLEVKYIPPKSMFPNIIKSLGAHGRRVEVGDRYGKALKTYYVGGVSPDASGTYMMMEGSDQPFVVTMKFFYGSVSVRFFMDEKDWRDLRLYPFDRKQILSFSMEYPRERGKSFTLRRTGGDDWTVTPYYDLTPGSGQSPDRDRVLSYLDRLNSLKIEGFENDNPDRDSLSHTLPFCVTHVLYQDSTERIATFHSILPHDKDGAILLGQNGRPLPVERYHVNSNWGDFMMVQHEPFSRLFWSYDMFFR